MTMSERVQQLRRSRTPFVHATVVRAQQPTSAHPGDQAILLSDGTIEGFVGGQCAQNSVRKAALGLGLVERPGQHEEPHDSNSQNGAHSPCFVLDFSRP